MRSVSFAIPVLLLGAVVTLGGCAVENTTPPVTVSTAADGTQHVSSDTFSITGHPAVVELEDANTRLVYRVDLENLSDTDLRNVNVQITSPAELAPYLTSGVLSSPKVSFDIASADKEYSDFAPDEARSIDLSDTRSLRNMSALASEGLNAENVLTLASPLTVTVQWRGHKETYTVDVAVTDPDGLLTASP